MDRIIPESSPSFHNALWQAPPIEPTRPRRLDRPNSWVGHMPFAFWIVGALRPTRLVELGVHTGNSYSSFCQSVELLDLQTICAGVDQWHGDVQAGFYGDSILADLKAHHDPRYGHFSTLMRMSFEEAVDHYEDDSFDLLHAVVSIDVLPCTDWEAELLVQRLIKEIRPDCITLMGAVTYQFAAGFAAHSQSVVTVLDEHDRDGQHYMALDVIGHWTGALILHSQATAQRIEAICPNIEAVKRRLIPPGINGFPPLPPPLYDTTCDAVRSWLRPDNTSPPFVIALDGTSLNSDTYRAMAQNLTAKGLDQSIRFAWIGSEQVDTSLHESAGNGGRGVSLADEDLRPFWQIVGQLSDLYVSLDDVPHAQQRGLKFLLAGRSICLTEGSDGPLECIDAEIKTRARSYKAGRVDAICDAILEMTRRSTQASAGEGLQLKRLQSVYDVYKYLDAYKDTVQAAKERRQRLVQYADRIESSGAFDNAYYCGAELNFSAEVTIRHYCSASANVDHGFYRQYFLRRPFAGFNPLIYAEAVKESEGTIPENPLDHYLSNGRPQGPWANTLLTPGSYSSPSEDLNVAVHGHFNYPELFGDFIRRFDPSAKRLDFIVTVTNEHAEEIIREQAEGTDLNKLEVIICENVGRDVGPFVQVLDYIQPFSYDVIGHFHGKKSTHLSSSHADAWRNFLWEHLIGATAPMVDTILSAFTSEGTLGLVFPEDPLVLGWGQNVEFKEQLRRRAGIERALPDFFDFPVGNMFWARPDALSRLSRMNLSSQDYPKEPFSADGTVLHTIERLLPFIVQKEGYAIATTHVSGIVRQTGG